jgi:hypothetical protein
MGRNEVHGVSDFDLNQKPQQALGVQEASRGRRGKIVAAWIVH